MLLSRVASRPDSPRRDDGQRLSVVLQRLLLLAEIEVHLADIVERRGFPGPIPHGAIEGQRLGVVLQRLLLLAEIGVHLCRCC
jgi:hypothetical protein